MNKFTLILILVLAYEDAYSKISNWSIDAAHSKIGFEISHLLISSVEGRFNRFSGKIKFDTEERNPTLIMKETAFEVDIDTDSIDTGNVKRDNHLKSSDFFNVKKLGHEKIKFRTKKISTTNGKKLKVTGDLTINNKTKLVTVVFKYLGAARLYDIDRIAFSGNLRIKREDFGLLWNDGAVKASTVAGKIVEATGAIGSEVKINIKIQATKEKNNN